MNVSPHLSNEELERYNRQILLFGAEKQYKLKKAKVLVAGIGGLGCPASLYLVAAGIGKIILADAERVELSNLNRQILHWTEDIGKFKVDSAYEKLRKLNPNVKIECFKERINEDNIYDLVSSVDLVVDGMDNWKMRFIINKACVELGKPFIHAGVRGLYGQLLVVIPGKGPCLQCVFPKEPRESHPFPILGATAGLLAMLEVTEAIKILLNYGSVSIGKLIIYDGVNMEFHELTVQKRDNCSICSSVKRV